MESSATTSQIIGPIATFIAIIILVVMLWAVGSRVSRLERVLEWHKEEIQRLSDNQAARRFNAQTEKTEWLTAKQLEFPRLGGDWDEYWSAEIKIRRSE